MFRHALSLASMFGCAFALVACGNGEPPQQLPRPVMVVHPQPASEARESYPGEVHARYEPELAFRIGGKVVERLVEAGDRVRKDQPLARLDPQDVRLQLDGMRAQVAAAEANLRVAKAEHDRYKALLGRQLVSQSQFDNADNAYRAAAARLQQARAEFDVASNQVDYAVLRATSDGLIAQRRVEVGQVVAAGQTAFVLAADGERDVITDFQPGADLFRACCLQRTGGASRAGTERAGEHSPRWRSVAGGAAVSAECGKGPGACLAAQSRFHRRAGRGSDRALRRTAGAGPRRAGRRRLDRPGRGADAQR